MTTITRTAYWIFDDHFIVPTYLSVFSFLKACTIPVVLVFYGKRIKDVETLFSSMISQYDVMIDYKEDDFFQLPVLPHNKSFISSIRNRELRFYVAAQSSPHNVVYCFDSDTLFTESAKDLMSIDFGECPAICGCIEQEHTYDNKLYFERGILHSNTHHIYPERQKEKYDQIFEEDTSYWLNKPQYNNGVLIFYNAWQLAAQWKTEHQRGLYCLDVNPGEDQVTLTAAINKVGFVECRSIPSRYNSMGQLTGDYAIFHGTGGQWSGELINAMSTIPFIQNALSDFAKVYKLILQQQQDPTIYDEIRNINSTPRLYHSIKGFFFFKPAYEYLFNILAENSTFVEIGTYQGKSICYMAELMKGQKKSIKLYSIDNYSNIGYPEIIHYEDASVNLSRFGMLDFITLIDSDSGLASKGFFDESIDCVYLDGDCRYDGVLSDLCNWYGKIRSGGILAGNNYTRISSVRMAVDVFCKNKDIQFSILEQSFIIIKP